MKKHPYKGLPPFQFWDTSHGPGHIRGLNPVSSTRFQFDRSTKIAAAGSCFAQHVARQITLRGYNFVVTEPAHPMIKRPAFFNYGLFTARYGNIYTARQLKQLIERAYGQFCPSVTSWLAQDGKVVDPFRPQIEPGRFISADELARDVEQHLSCVREMLETAEVFVFTLGLTEAWEHVGDGAVYPLAPGIAGGRYDESVRFKNFTVAEIFEDMCASIDRMMALNPAIKILLSVSPIPLKATFEPRHVLQSTVYSKSVLRVAAQMLFDKYPNVDYFPSYEIITAPQTSYFEGDMRSVVEEGVAHVMDIFFAAYALDGGASAAVSDAQQVGHEERVEQAMDLFCDEDAISAA